MMTNIRPGTANLLQLLSLLPLLILVLISCNATSRLKKEVPFEVITGQVVNTEDYAPITNVEINVQESNVKGTTDQDGYFKVKIPAKAANNDITVLFKKQGYKSVEFFTGSPTTSESLILLVGLKEQILNEPSAAGSFTSAMKYENDKDAALIPSHLLVKEKVEDLIRHKKETALIKASDYPVVITNGRTYITGNYGTLTVTSKEYMLYVDDNLLSVDSINKRYKKDDFASYTFLSPDQASKISKADAAVIKINTVTALTTDTIPNEKAKLDSPKMKMAPPIPPVPMKRRLPPGVKAIEVKNNRAVVELKNGKTETYDLSKPAEKAEYEKKYESLMPVEPRNSKQVTPLIGNVYMVAPDKMKMVLKRGLENNELYAAVRTPIDLKIENIPDKDLHLTFDNGILQKLSGIYYVSPAKPGKAELRVSRKSADGEIHLIKVLQFKVSRLPDPVSNPEFYEQNP